MEGPINYNYLEDWTVATGTRKVTANLIKHGSTPYGEDPRGRLVDGYITVEGWCSEATLVRPIDPKCRNTYVLEKRGLRQSFEVDVPLRDMSEGSIKSGEGEKVTCLLLECSKPDQPMAIAKHYTLAALILEKIKTGPESFKRIGLVISQREQTSAQDSNRGADGMLRIASGWWDEKERRTVTIT